MPQRFVRLFVAALVVFLAFARTSQAGMSTTTAPAFVSPVPCGDVATLVTDLMIAQIDGLDNAIDLGGCTFSLAAVNNTASGANGLPAVNEVGHSVSISNGTILNDGTAEFRILIVTGGSLTLSQVLLTGGVAPALGSFDAGGGNILATGANASLTITDSTITNGLAKSGFGGGIEIADGATFTMTGSSVVNNSCVGNGGGFGQYASGAITISNSTFSGNSATVALPEPAFGGGLYFDEAAGAVSITSCTVVGNNADSRGGGINIGNFPITIDSSIIAQNLSGDGLDRDFRQGAATPATLTYSVVGRPNDAPASQPAFTADATDQVGTIFATLDPLLFPLANNGGYTQTFAPMDHSPALEGGRPGGLALDQRGTTRSATKPTAGAYERTTLLTITPTAPSSLLPGQTVTFTATGGGRTYTFTLDAPSGGTFDSSTGIYTAGTLATTDTLTVTDGTTTLRVPISVNAVTISPATASVAAGGSIRFTATGGSGSYIFSLDAQGSGAATIDPGTGVYTAGATMGDDVVTVRDTFSSASAVVHVSAAAVALPIVLTPTSRNAVPRGTLAFTASGGAPPLTFDLAVDASGGSMSPDGSYRAGPFGGVVDVVRVTDATGQAVTADVTVGRGLSLSASTANVAPNGSFTFHVTGGAPPYHWAFVANPSGGTLDASGLYKAGSTPNTTDEVRVTDSLGNSATAQIGVGGGIVIGGADNVAPLGRLALAASGGSGPFTWSLADNQSGGTIDGSGAYSAGTKGNVVDTVLVRDSNGNHVGVAIQVTAALAIAPATATVQAGGHLAFSISGGSPGPHTVTVTSNGSGGSVAANGVYTAGPTAGTDSITVTDANGASVTVTVTVTAAPASSPDGGAAGNGSTGSSGAPGVGAPPPAVGAGGPGLTIATGSSGGDSGGCLVSSHAPTGSELGGLGLLGLVVGVARRRRLSRRATSP